MKKQMVSLVALVLLLGAGMASASYYNYASFDSSSYPFVASWSASNYWSTYAAGTKFHASGGALPNPGIGLRADQAASVVPLTLSMPMANGTYDISVVDYLSSNWWTLPQGINFEIEGVAVTFNMPGMTPVAQTGSMGEFTVTDGKLDILVKDTFFTSAPTANWVAFSGFEVVSVPEPVTLTLMALSGMFLVRRKK